MTLTVGQAAPDAEVYRSDGAKTMLHSYWNTRPVVLTFLRHLGCVFCRELISKLRTAYPDFVERGAAVIAVAQGNPPQAAHFANMFRVPFPILADPSRQAYRAFGLSESNVSGIAGPTVMLQMAKATLHGHLPGIGEHVRAATSSDGSSIRQVGGTFVIDQAGILRYVHVAAPIYTHPTLDELLLALDV